MTEASINTPRKRNTVVLMVTPNMDPAAILAVASLKETKAIILITYATGTTPENLNGAIQKVTQGGIPIFLLANNPGGNTGILNDIGYQTQAESKTAGAIAIQKVDINHLLEFLDTVQDEIDNKKTGSILGETIRTKYAYQPGEEKPKADWEIPAKIAEQRKLYEQTLRRRGIPEDDIMRTLDQWEGT